MAKWTTRTLGEFRHATEFMDDETRIEWTYDGPEECCDEHVHDITMVYRCDAVVTVTPGSVEVLLSGGEV